MRDIVLQRTHRPAVSPLWKLFAAGMLLAATPLPGTVAQAASPAELAEALGSSGKLSRDIRAVYAARGYRPIWLRNGMPGEDAYKLVRLLASAELDQLDPSDYKVRALEKALERARGGAVQDAVRAEALLSRSFVAYVRDLRRTKARDVYFVDKLLRPSAPPVSMLLDGAARARSISAYLSEMPWMHPTYVGLRNALAAQGDPRSEAARLLQLNLQRARVLPADMGRHVVVDAVSQRLTMYENSRAVDSMKVIVGKPEQHTQTPMMAGLMRYTVVNPYWNVPPDLVRDRIARNVLDKGPGYIRSSGYEILSDWSANARVIPAEQVDWHSVAAGRTELRVRQLPGRDNMMGRAKFMFPNQLGIYLHDTPDKHLFQSATRTFSSGCVRLEDAARLARWLHGKPLPKLNAPEQAVLLPQPVPVYITYLTAAPAKQGVAFRKDVYGRDFVQQGKRRSVFAGL